MIDITRLPSQIVLPLCAALAHLILGSYCLYRRKTYSDSPLRLFLSYVALTILWNINLANIILGWLPQPGADLSWVQISSYGLIAIGVCYWAFARAFLQLPWRRPAGWLLALSGLILALSFDQGWLVVPAADLEWSGGRLYPGNLGFTVSVVSWLILVGVTLVTVQFRQLLTSSPAHRNRIQFLLIATVLSMAGYGLYLSLTEPFWTIGLILTWCGSMVTTYIVAVEDLLDLSTATRYAITALITIVVTVLVYVAGLFLVQIILGDLLAATRLTQVLDPFLLVAIVTTVLLTAIYLPLQRTTQRLTNRLIFGRNYSAQRVIQDYTQAVGHLLCLDELTGVGVAQLQQDLAISEAVFFVLEGETPDGYWFRTSPPGLVGRFPQRLALSKQTPVIARLTHQREPLSQYTIDISTQFRHIPENDRQLLKALQLEWYVPVLKKDQLMSLIGLGRKQSSHTYTARDLRVLMTIADQTALALENASLVDRLHRNLDDNIRVKNLMNNVFDSIQSGVVTLDMAGQITLYNRAAEAILKLASRHVIGLPYGEVFPALADTIFANLVKNVIEHDHQYTNYEIISILPERGRVNFNFSLTPLKNALGETQGVTVAFQDITETKRLKAVQNMFRRYVSPAVVDRLPADPGELELGGHRRMITVLFADIRGFTRFSEHLDPEQLVDTLNEYLSMAAASILMYEGTLDKFVGDAVMGIFNAPLDQPDHSLRAVRAALNMQRTIHNYHEKLGEERRLSFGIGLHVGEAVVGNVGMSDRMDYTAIGDTVNLAKRIQENTPGDKILISEAVFEQVKDFVEAVFYQELQVKNREQPVRTYELLGS